MNSIVKLMIGSAFTALALAGSATAQGTGEGPVATACKAEIEKFCPGMKHGQGEVRACLEQNKDKVGADCKKALDTTGPGRR